MTLQLVIFDLKHQDDEFRESNKQEINWCSSYGSSVVTERMRLQIEVAEMSFLQRVAAHFLRDRKRSSVFREGE